MGCTSSTPTESAVAVNATAKTKQPPAAGTCYDAKKNHDERKREKTVTAGTETMAATTHDEEDDSRIDPPAFSAAAAVAAATTPATNSKKDDEDHTEAATSEEGRAVLVAGTLAVRYACSTRKGRDPDDKSKPNQDRYGVVHNIHSDDDEAFFLGVYDGHGPHGELCSNFVQRRLPDLVKKHIDHRVTIEKQKRNEQNDADGGNLSNSSTSCLSIDQIQASLSKAHVECNDEMRSAQEINDMFSGTTSISMYVHSTTTEQNANTECQQSECRITVCNVGDSRAVLGTTNGGASSSLQAVPLSKDQTPYRSDEAARCVQNGARILSFGQIEGNGNNDGDDDSDYSDDSVEDPPRVWAPKGRFPGTAFTRSIGDAVAEKLGVCAEPEMLTLKVSRNERVIVLASDGIFDVMSNQEVVDLCFQHYRGDPARACEAVIAKSHEEWLLNDECVDEESASYDDMTIACIFIDDVGGNDESKEAVGDSASAVEQLPTPPSTAEEQPQPQEKRAKRVRQKTLRNLEEMDEEK